jgi:hypothetical protein
MRRIGAYWRVFASIRAYSRLFAPIRAYSRLFAPIRAFDSRITDRRSIGAGDAQFFERDSVVATFSPLSIIASSCPSSSIDARSIRARIGAKILGSLEIPSHGGKNRNRIREEINRAGRKDSFGAHFWAGLG